MTLETLMPDILIRPLEEKDILACAKVNVATWQHAYADIIDADYLAAMSVEKSFDEWQSVFLNAQKNSQRHFMVAVDKQEKVYGYSSVIIPNECNFWTSLLTTLYVLPTHHGQSVGKKLLVAAKNWAVQQGAATMGLWVFAENKLAIDFYLHQGFEKQAHIQEKIIGARTHFLESYMMRL